MSDTPPSPPRSVEELRRVFLTAVYSLKAAAQDPILSDESAEQEERREARYALGELTREIAPMLDALLSASAREATEEACKAMCSICAGDEGDAFVLIPTLEHEEWWHAWSEKYGGNGRTRCDASKIRALAGGTHE